MSPALDNSVHHFHHPGCTFSTWRALATRLVFVELGHRFSDQKGTISSYAYVCETSDGRDNVSALVHNNDGTSSQTGLSILEGVVIHAKAVKVNTRSAWDNKALTELPSTCQLVAQGRNCHQE